MVQWLSLLAQPATVIGIGLAALAILAMHGSGGAAVRWLSVILAVFYFALASPLGANLLVGVLEDRADRAEGCLEPPGPSGPGVFVVLAGGITGPAAGARDFERLKEGSLRRVLAAVRLAERFPASSVILSGGAGGPVREADLMAGLARAMGIADRRLRIDRDSDSTYESAVNLAPVLRGGPGAGVYLITSAMHMPRALATFRARGIAACPIPVDRQLIRPALHEMLIPQLSALVKSSAALHEILGQLAYRLTGRI